MKLKQYMKKYNIFLQWWLIFSIINLGIVGSYISELIFKVNEMDVTKLSFVIFGIFYIFVIKLGTNIYRFCSKKITVKVAGKNNEPGWFVSDVLLTLGMIGTVFGFIIMLSSSFSNINTENMASIQHALTTMSGGMSTALFTTASGLICSMILKIQLFMFDKFLSEKNNVTS